MSLLGGMLCFNLVVPAKVYWISDNRWIDAATGFSRKQRHMGYHVKKREQFSLDLTKRNCTGRSPKVNSRRTRTTIDDIIRSESNSQIQVNSRRCIAKDD
jgi:hypothetical protein